MLGALFVLIFMAVAAFGVDMSQYLYRDMKLQKIADGAALAGAQALDQRLNKPNFDGVHGRIIRYIKHHQGPNHANRYTVESETYVEGIEIGTHHSERIDGEIDCLPDFEVANGSLKLLEPARLETRLLGSAITNGRGERFPVTAMLTLRNGRGQSSDYELWGPYNNPRRGDLNTRRYFPPKTILASGDSTTVNVRGQSWTPDGDWYIEVSTENGHMRRDHTRFLENGDRMPNVGGGAHSQDPVTRYLEPFVNDNNRVELAPNQVIVLMELGTKGDLFSDKLAREVHSADFQDVVLLVSVNQPRGNDASKRGDFTSSSPETSRLACEGSYYRVGVTVIGGFNPYFLPGLLFGSRFGSRTARMVASAVAEARPNFMTHERVRRRNPIGRIQGSPPYAYRDPSTAGVSGYYGLDGSSRGCRPGADLVVCTNLPELINGLGNDVRLDDQLLYLKGGGGLEIDPSRPDAVHSLRGSGYVLVDGEGKAIRVGQNGSRPGIIQGDLDIVALEGDILIDELTDDYALKGYLMAPKGQVRFGNKLAGDLDVEIFGGVYGRNGVLETSGLDLDVTPSDFCPTRKASELCRSTSNVKPGSTPYTWSISLVD